MRDQTPDATGLVIDLVFAAIGFVIWAFVNFWIIRAAVRSAMTRLAERAEQTYQLQSRQTEHLYQLSRHTAAQTELMLITARSHGLTEQELSPVTSNLSKPSVSAKPDGIYGF